MIIFAPQTKEEFFDLLQWEEEDAGKVCCICGGPLGFFALTKTPFFRVGEGKLACEEHFGVARKGHGPYTYTRK